MAENSKIGWTTHTHNPWIGCLKRSPACQFCYADAMVSRFGGDFAGVRRVTSEGNWKRPTKWNRDAAQDSLLYSMIVEGKDTWLKVGTTECYKVYEPALKRLVEGGTVALVDGKWVALKQLERPRVFCASLADVFEDWDGEMHDHGGNAHYTRNGDPLTFVRSPDAVDCDMDGYHYTTMSDTRARLFALIDATQNLDWLLLTKRPENIKRMWPKIDVDDFPAEWDMASDSPKTIDNVWLGTTVENQEYADRRIPELLKCSDLAEILFLSVEPMLGPVDLGTAFGYTPEHGGYFNPWRPTVRWVICGAESGPKRRPMDLTWVRSLRDQCRAARVPFFMKQLEVDGKVTDDINQFPEDLRIQEFPKTC